MPVIACPHCLKTLLADDAPGTAGGCPHCGANFMLPSGGGEPLLLPGATYVTAALVPPPGIEEDLSPEDEAVLVELQKLQDQRPGWGSAVLILAVSLVLFLVATRAEGAWGGIAILVGVIFFHELGHYAAMRWFGYRNLRMFFIPFFGAAVSGHHYNVAGWKKALVALAGPIPGILLGVPLGLLGLGLNQQQIIHSALVLLILNGFNLLPFLPLDGGWVVHSILFVRHPVIDVLFRAVAALALLGIALLMKAWFLSAVAVAMLFGLPLAWKLASAAHRLRKEGLLAVSADAESIPASAALGILKALRPALPALLAPKLLAQYVANQT